MHTPSVVNLLVTGLVASSTVASFGTSSGAVALSRRNVAALIAIAAPALALPSSHLIDARHQYVFLYLFLLGRETWFSSWITSCN